MGASYAVYLADPFGVRVADVSSFISLVYSRIVNDIGALTLTLPSSFPISLLRLPDARLEVWRRLPSGREYLDTDTTWPVRKVVYKRDAQGRVIIALGAQTPLSLLREPGRF